jgi:acyl carrier protein
MFETRIQKASSMREELREFLTRNAATSDVGEFSDDDSLLELGIIDSVAMVDLIAHIESSYGITVDEDEMVPENFRSVAAIVRYIEGKRG